MENRKTFTSLDELKTAVLEGKDVYWGNTSYKVYWVNDNRYIIVCTNGYTFNLETNGVLECKLEDFYTF